MLYTLHIHHRKLIVPALLVLFLLLSVVGYGQNNEDCPSCHDCTATAQPIFSQFPYDTIRICAGGDTTIHIGYGLNNNIVIAAQEPRIIPADTVFISTSRPGAELCGDNSCWNYSPIWYYGYRDTIQFANDIEYVRLNIEHSRAADLNIIISCDSNHKASIFNYCQSNNNEAINIECDTSSVVRGWSIQPPTNYGFYKFGSPFTTSNSDPCTPYSYQNSGGYDYCWSNSTSSSIHYANPNKIYSNVDPQSRIFYASDTATKTNFYNPDESFENLIGCHLSSKWQIEIIDVWAQTKSGYLFDWEIKFADGVLQPAGNSVNGAAVLTADGQVDTNFTVSFTPNNDSTIVFHAPTVSHDTTFTRTLRLYDSTTGCWYDKVFTVMVMAPEGTAHHDTICEGESITLTAECASSETLIFSEGFSDITEGSDDNQHSGTPYGCTLPTFNICDPAHVFKAGGHLRFGDVDLGGGGNGGGHITSSSIDLSNPFIIKLWVRGWGNTSDSPWFYLKVNDNTVMTQDLPVSAYTAPYTQYTYPSTFVANSNSTITIGNSAIRQRFFLDSVAVVSNSNCQYAWNNGESTASITVTPPSSTPYYVTVTPSSGCARVDTFYVTVRPKPVITFDACSGRGTSVDTMHMRCQNGITLPAAVPCAADYEFVGWSTVPVDPTNSEPSLFHAGDNYLSDTDITLHAVYRKCTPTGNTKYSLVTSDTNDWSGNYLIVYTNKVFDGSLTSLDVTQNYQDEVNINNDIITLSSNQNYYFTIEPKTGGYSIRSASGIFIGKKTSSNNKIDTTRTYTNDFRNSIEYINNNDIRIKGIVDKYLRFNNENSQNRFRYYNEETFQPVQLYRGEPEMNCEYTSCPPLPHGDTTVIACGSFTWYGTPYDNTGDYSHTLRIDDCDSVVTLHLTVLNEEAATVHFEPGNGSPIDDMPEDNCLSSIVLPEATPCNAAFEFVGWATDSIVDSTSTLPSPLYPAGFLFNPSEDDTLYAVYKRENCDFGPVFTKVNRDTTDWSGEYLIAYKSAQHGIRIFNGALTPNSNPSLSDINNYMEVDNNLIVNNTINPTDTINSCTFLIAPLGGNYYSIKSKSSWYIGANAVSQGTATHSETPFPNTITYINDNYIRIISNSTELSCASNGSTFIYNPNYPRHPMLYRLELDGECYFWTWVPEPTISTNLPDTTDKGCNWDGSDAPTQANFTINNDNNPNAIVITPGDTIKNGCNRSLTWTANYSNACGQAQRQRQRHTQPRMQPRGRPHDDRRQLLRGRQLRRQPARRA